MIGAVHDEPNALGDCAELPDDQFVPDEWVMVGYVAFEIHTAGFAIVIVGVVANDDIGVFDDVFYKADAWDLWIGMDVVLIGAFHNVPPFLATLKACPKGFGNRGIMGNSPKRRAE